MNAADEEKLMDEIERDESWFARVLDASPEPACRGLEHIKLRTRIAIEERSVALGPGPAVSPGALARVKGSIRAELARQGSTPVQPSQLAIRSTLRFPDRLVGGSLAAAAAVVLLVTPMFWNESPVADDTSPAALVEDFAAVLTSLPGEQDVELMWIEGELEDLESGLATSQPQWNSSQFDDLGDEIDRLLAESNAEFDT